MSGIADPDKSVGITIFVNANTLAFGAAVSPPSYGLSDLVRSLPEGAAAFLAWVPDVAIDVVALTFDPGSKSFAVYGTAGPADSANPSASLLIASAEVAGSSGASYVVAVTLDSSIELGGVPLFGSMLDGISVSDLQFSYASRALPAGTIALPPPAPEPPPFAQGPQLSFVLSDGTNHQSFTLTPTGPAHLAASATPPVGPPIQWFEVQKSIGPLTIGRIGIVTGEDELGIALDASLQTTALSIDLTGFTLGFSPTSDISLHGLRISLDGLAVSFTSSAVQIVGSLLRTVVEVDHQPVTEYNGAIMIQAGVYAIAAIGSFAELDGHPSLFIFGMAKGEFGGPPAFFVTGLAAGFGVNRGLRLPAPDQVQDFPFVLMATMGGGYLPDPSTNAALSKLTEGGWVPPELGSYWLAAGIQFTSFELLRAFALLIVRFGNEFVVALLGIASISLPKGLGKPYAYAELTLDVVLDPGQGTFQMTALLTPNSFVLHPDCRLTGGFAFYLWFGSNEHAGDFVVTLGGYNSAFDKPAWYPDVPRLGISWKVSSEIQISGGAYFALTPGCVMAGGALSMRFAAGDLKAWFDAHADFIIWWQPFYFDVSIGVSIGASYTLDLGFVRKTFTVSLGADVELWGPPLAGVAHVNWWVISFTIAINGGGRPKLPGRVIDWPTFEATFLPAPPDPSRASAPTAPPNTGICRPRAAAGLTATAEQDGDPVWLVSADQFVLATETLIPATRIEITGPTPETSRTFEGPAISAYPMGKVSLDSIHTLLVRPADSSLSAPATLPLDLSRWAWAPAAASVPSAMWGADNNGSAELTATTVPGLTGITGTPPAPVVSGPPAFAISALKYVDLSPTRPLPLDTHPHDGSTEAPGQDPRTVIRDSIALAPVVATRAAIAADLNRCGIGVQLLGGELGLLAADLDLSLPQNPMLGPVGTTGPGPPANDASDANDAHETPAIQVTGETAEPPGAPPDERPVPVTVPHDPPQAPQIVAVFDHSGRRTRACTAGAVASRAERRGVMSATDGTDPSLWTVLAAGSLVVWHLQPAPLRSLHAQGALPVHAWSFDGCDRLVGHTTLPGRSGDPVRLPEGTCRVALATGQDTWRDWWPTDDLLQLAPQALLAGSVVVRPQAPQRLRTGRGRRTGVLSARQLAAENWVQTANGRQRGWLDCWLPGGTSRVELTVSAAREQPAGHGPLGGLQSDPTSAELWVASGSDPRSSLVPVGWQTAVHADQTQHAHLAGTLATHLTADLPSCEGAVRIRVRTTPDWQVTGLRAAPPPPPGAPRPDQRGGPGQVAGQHNRTTRVGLR